MIDWLIRALMELQAHMFVMRLIWRLYKHQHLSRDMARCLIAVVERSDQPQLLARLLGPGLPSRICDMAYRRRMAVWHVTGRRAA